MQRPDEIAARILAKVPVQVPVSDPVGFARYQTEMARKLARYPDVALGDSNPERWAKIQQRLIDIGAISRPIDLEAFLYKPATAVGQDSEWPVPVLLVAAGALALSITAGLLWHRGLRWSAPASAAVSGRPLESNRRAAPELRPTDLNATLAALERSLRRRLPRSIDCRFSLLPGLWPCLSDANAIAKVVRDLVAAAVEDMPGGGDLVVGTRQFAIDDGAAVARAADAVGDYVRLTVKDNGSGLSAECLDKIFDPAVTVRPAVAAARELARRLGGFAQVESVEGAGTAVHLYFRRADASGEAAQQMREEVSQARAAAA